MQFNSRVLFLIVGLCLILTQTASGQPSLTSVAPRGLIPGQAVSVTVRGDQLTEPLHLWSPTAIQVDQIQIADDGKSLTCVMTADASCPVHICGLIAASASGVSDPILLMVDDLPSAADNGSNHVPGEAQEVADAIAIDGVFDGPQSDFYRVTLEAGQRLGVEVVTQRMAVAFDPILRVLSSDGNELAIADDSPGLGADCQLPFEADVAGDYLIEVRDNRYRSGGVYRLRIGDFPVVTTSWPMGGRLGATTRFQFTGLESDSALSLIKRLPYALDRNRLAISVRHSEGGGSAMAQIAVSELPEHIEVEPNDQPEQALSVTVPCAVSGVLNADGDLDCFEFALAKGQRIDCTGDSRRFGSPALVYLQLFDAQGGSVAQTSVNDADDSQISYTAPADGMYRLAVRDLIHRGGEVFAYRVAIHSGPDFSLTLKHADTTRVKYPVSKDDRALALTVSVQRRGYDGPIRLMTQEPHPGLKLYNQTIPGGASEVRVFALLPAGTAEAEFLPLRFVGVAEIDGREVRRTVTTEPTLRAAIPQLAYPYPWQDGLFTVAVTGAADPLFTISCEADGHSIPRGGQLQLPLTLERKNEDFKGDLTVFPEQRPADCQAEVKSDKDVYTLTISCGNEAPTGDASLRLVMMGEHAGRTQSFVQDIAFQIVMPESPTEAKDSAQQAD